MLDGAANAVALLSGEPLTERRFLMNFSTRAEAIDRPGMVPGLLGLLGAPRIKPMDLTSWVGEWENTLDALPEEERHPRLHPYRRKYYRLAFDAIIGGGQAENVLWPLLRNWTLAVQTLPEGDPALQSWKDVCLKLGLMGDEFSERITGLEMFLDQVGEAINEWAEENGG
jgi:hypothetical protein